jgi:hypothetical protein
MRRRAKARATGRPGAVLPPSPRSGKLRKTAKFRETGNFLAGHG